MYLEKRKSQRSDCDRDCFRPKFRHNDPIVLIRAASIENNRSEKERLRKYRGESENMNHFFVLDEESNIKCNKLHQWLSEVLANIPLTVYLYLLGEENKLLKEHTILFNMVQKVGSNRKWGGDVAFIIS